MASLKKVVEQEKPAWLTTSIKGKPASGMNNPAYNKSATSTTDTATNDISSMYDTLLKGSTDAVNANTNATVSEALYQKSLLPDQYSAARGGAYTTGRLQAIGNNEALANQGLSGALYSAPTSGTSETSRGAQNISMQNAVNSFSKQEQDAMNTLDREILKAKTAGNVEIARLASENRANLMQALIAKKEQKRQEDLATAEKTKQESISNLGQYQGDIKAEIDRREAIDPNDEMLPYLRKQRVEKQLAQATAAAEAEQQAFENNLAERKTKASEYTAYKKSSGSSKSSTSKTSGLTTKQISDIAMKAATTGGTFDKAVYNDMINELSGTNEAEPQSTQGTSSNYSNVSNANEQTQVKNIVAQFEGGRISKEALNRQLSGLGYRYNSNTGEVDAI